MAATKTLVANPAIVAAILQAFEDYGITSEQLAAQRGNRPPGKWTTRDTADLLALIHAGPAAIAQVFPSHA